MVSLVKRLVTETSTSAVLFKSTDINSHIGKVQNSFKGISQLKPISKPITTPTNSEKKNG